MVRFDDSKDKTKNEGRRRLQKKRKLFSFKESQARRKKELEDIQLLPDVDNRKLSFKERTNRWLRYHDRADVLTVIIIAICLFAGSWGIDYLHNKVFVSKDNIHLTSKKSDKMQLTFVGDIMMDRGNRKKAQYEKPSTFFANSKKLWNNSDLVFGNLESAIINNPAKFHKKPDKDIHLRMSTSGLDAISQAGFTTLGTANNHVGDYGRRGMTNTIKALNNRNIDFSGLGENAADSLKYQIYDIDGVKVSFLAVTDIIPKHTSVKQDRPGALTTSNNDYLALIKEAAAQSDYTIVYSHWGNENGLSVTERQRYLGRKMSDAGADVIVGMHSHVVQPIEKYKNSLILYGMGNFVFEQEQSRTKDSVVANLRMNKNGQLFLEMIPMRIKDGVPTVTKNPFFKRRIFHQLNKDLKDSDYQVGHDTMLVKNFGYQYKIR